MSTDGTLASGGMLEPPILSGGRLLKLIRLTLVIICAGYDGVAVWNLSDGRRVEAPSGGQALRGPVSSIAWVSFDDSDVLIYGTAGGYLCVRRRAKNVSFVFPS